MPQTHSPRRKGRLLFGGFLALALLPFLWPERRSVPVVGATAGSFNPRSFWFEPWGPSKVHKGIDVFAPKGTPIVAPIDGIVLYSGQFERGGEVLLVLGPKWRLHYLAHLERRDVRTGRPVVAGTPLGTVGDSGNARGKPPHLHYSIVTLFPHFWRIDRSTHGWKKAFYLDPGSWLFGSATPAPRG